MKKTFQLLIATLLLATSATAQRYRGNARSEKYAPTVYLVSAREVGHRLRMLRRGAEARGP